MVCGWSVIVCSVKVFFMIISLLDLTAVAHVVEVVQIKFLGSGCIEVLDTVNRLSFYFV